MVVLTAIFLHPLSSGSSSEALAGREGGVEPVHLGVTERVAHEGTQDRQDVPPPETMPTAANCEAPEKSRVDSAIVCHRLRPAATDSAPKLMA
jgi:hypothetical protein